VLAAASQAIGRCLVAELLLVGFDVLEADPRVHRWFLSVGSGLVFDGHILASIDAPAIAHLPSYPAPRPFIWEAILAPDPLADDLRL
jgi:hypothetical protein